MKLGAWALTGSVAMLGSLLDSALDLVASGINLLAIRQAIAPADHEHRFGHGKAEPIAGLGQAAVIAGSATFLLLESIGRLIAPVTIAHSSMALWVIGVSLALTLALVLFQRHVIAKTGSIAVAADHLHYAGDLAMNAIVILALVLSGIFGWANADALGGIIIAGLIAYGAWEIFRGSYDQLMDREFEDGERERIKAAVLAHPDVRQMHDLRTRRAGSDIFIQFHVELDGNMPLSRAHRISDEVEDRVKLLYPDADVTIHQDPAGYPERVSALARA
ncbi:MAG: cation diffusion facilitator family transporter [Alphaproteobacteria bacterium]|nr:cation diffusion facilitator family transporter [Alphaproteobacteria bacterium]